MSPYQYDYDSFNEIVRQREGGWELGRDSREGRDCDWIFAIYVSALLVSAIQIQSSSADNNYNN